MDANPHAWIAALRGSQQRLASLAGSLSPEQLRGPSYCTDWTIAQVLSHIGSQAEIAQLSLAAALTGQEPPGPDDFKPIWAVWNARDPGEQAAQCLIEDAEHVRQLEHLTDDQLDGIHLQMLGMEFDAVGLVWLRLGEHALHSWDVAVTLDPDARIDPGAVALLIDRVQQVAAWAGKPPGEPLRARIQSTDPGREFLLDVGESVSLTPAEGAPAADDGTPRIRMSAEALLRLVYGRLDPAHSPPVDELAGHIDLDLLRRTFPGL
jgi:uncharacterized protein (TIGR03083 family)